MEESTREDAGSEVWKCREDRRETGVCGEWGEALTRRWRGGYGSMTLKWLEERWQVFMPTLAGLGKGQEEQIKMLCEAEIAAWRERPRMKQANSIRKPLTETRNRIRETFTLSEENTWCNPKSGASEHLSLKYLNFSSQEWIDLTLPAPDVLSARQKNPQPVADPEGLLQQIDRLFEQRRWPELVLAVGMATGRSVAEILKTGEFGEKTAYSVWFAGPMTVYQMMCEPFEVPTLVRAEQVVTTVEHLRELFGQHFARLERADVSRQASPFVKEAAMTHFWGRIALHPAGNQNLLHALLRGIYPHLAVYAYCPTRCDELLYMATIQNHRKILEANCEQERLTFATAAGYLEYRLVDEAGKPEQARGTWLSKPGVEVLSVFSSGKREGSQEMKQAEEQRGQDSEEEEEVEQAMSAMVEEEEEEDWDIEDEIEELREALSYVIVDREGTSDRRQGMMLGKPGVKVVEVFAQEGGASGPEEWVTIKIGEPAYAALEAVGAGRRGSLAYDTALSILIDAYDGLYGSGLLEQVKRVAGVAASALLVEEQEQDLVTRALGTMRAREEERPNLFSFVQQAVVAYSRECVHEEAGNTEDLGVEGVAEVAAVAALGKEPGGGMGGMRQVLLNVRAQAWERCMQIKSERGLPSDDAVIALLHQAFVLLYGDGELRREVARMAGLALSCLGLHALDRGLIQEAMGYEEEGGEESRLFPYLQESLLVYARTVVDDCRPRDPSGTAEPGREKGT